MKKKYLQKLFLLLILLALGRTTNIVLAQTAQASYNLALDALKQDKFSHALSLALGVRASLSSPSPRVELLLAETYLRMNDPVHAKIAMNRVMSILPNSRKKGAAFAPYEVLQEQIDQALKEAQQKHEAIQKAEKKKAMAEADKVVGQWENREKAKEHRRQNEEKNVDYFYEKIRYNTNPRTLKTFRETFPDSPYDDKVARVQQKEEEKERAYHRQRQAVIDRELKEAIENERFRDGLAAVKFQGNWGFINENGDLIVPFVYSNVFSFSEGLAAVEFGSDGWGFINKSHEAVIPFRYDNVRDSFYNGTAFVRTGNTYQLIDKEGVVVRDLSAYDYVSKRTDPLILVELEVAASANCSGTLHQYGFIDHQGNTRTDVVYSSLNGGNHEAVKYGNSNRWIYRIEKVNTSDCSSTFGVLDEAGREIIPPIFDEVEVDDFEETGNLMLARRGGKWGIIDTTGGSVVPFSYDEALPIYRRFWSVQQDRKWGAIYRNGRMAVAPRYDERLTIYENEGAEASASGVLDGQEVKVDLSQQPALEAARRDYGTLQEVVTMLDPTALSALLADGEEVDRPGSGGATALHIAAMRGFQEGAHLLLKAGADLHARTEGEVWVTDFSGGLVEVLSHQRETGITPLHAAAAHGHHGIVGILLKRGARLEDKTEAGQTALHLAAKAGHLNAVQMLLEAGADGRAEDLRGDTPLILAEVEQHRDVVRLLERHALLDQK